MNKKYEIADIARFIMTISFIDMISFDQLRDSIEAACIQFALNLHNGNRTRAAKSMQVNRTTLIERMKRLGINNFKKSGGRPHGKRTDDRIST